MTHLKGIPMCRVDPLRVPVPSPVVSNCFRAAMTLLLLGLFSRTVPAINIWVGAGGNNNWTTGANWSPFFGPPPNNGTDVIVMQGTTRLTPVVNTPQSIHSLTFNNTAGAFVILGTQELTIGAGGITNNDADIQSVIGPVKLSADQIWNTASGRLQMDVVNLNGRSLTLTGAHPIDLANTIAGPGALTIADAYTSTVTMLGGGSNTYAGPTDVQSGMLKLQKGGVAVPGDLTIGNGTIVLLAANEQISEVAGNEVTVNSGGLLDVNSRTETLNSLTVNTGGSVSATTGTLNITESLHVTGGTITANLGLGDITANVTSGGQVTSAADLKVGDAATGSLNISGGGDMTSATGYIGNQISSTGAVTVDGSGSTWTNSGDLYVGNAGDATLDILSGGEVSDVNAHIGDDAGSIGTVTVSGVNSAWNSSGALYVGNAGNGTLNIIGDGYVESVGGYVGYAAGASGQVFIDGAESEWLSRDAYVGFFGDGAVTVANGGLLRSSGPAYLGYRSSGSGDVSVSGAGSQWLHKGGELMGNQLNVGHRGDGTVSIGQGASLLISSMFGESEVIIGDNAAGNIQVDGVGTFVWTYSINFQMDVGVLGEGTLEVVNGAQFSVVNQKDSAVDNHTTVTIGRGTASTGTVTIDGAGSLLSMTTFYGTPVINVGLAGTAALNVSNSGQLSAPGPIHVTGTGAGTLNIITGGQVTCESVDVGNSFGGENALSIASGGVLQAANVTAAANGELRGNGTIIGMVQNGGVVSPGTSPDALSIDGDYTQSAAGELLIELASLTSHDQLLVTGTATLNGTLTINFIDGFTPSAGQSFTILSADDVDGTFGMQSLPSVPNLAFDVIYTPQSVVLTVVPALPGDFNADGAVNAADYVVWRKGILPPNAPTDYDTWRQHFAEPPVGSGNANPAIPEPTSLVLFALSLLQSLRCRRVSLIDNSPWQSSLETSAHATPLAA